MFVFVGSLEEKINTGEKLMISVVFYLWFLLIMRTNKYYTFSYYIFYSYFIYN